MKLGIAFAMPMTAVPIRQATCLKVASQPPSLQRRSIMVLRSDTIVACCLMVGAFLSCALFLATLVG